MANFETFQVLCNGLRQNGGWRRKLCGRHTLGVIIALKDLVHVLELLLPLLCQGLLLLLTSLDPVEGLVYIVFGVTKRNTFEFCVEFSLVLSPGDRT